MKKSLLRKVLRIVGLLFLIVVIVLGVIAYRMISPKSDKQILEAFEGEKHQPYIRFSEFQGQQVRTLEMQKEIDSTLPVLVFIHGSPGSSLDFKRYLKDEELNAQYNLIAYDRVGYSDRNPGTPLASVEEEVQLLHSLLKGLNLEKTVILGYSYGGTVAMASPLSYKRKVALAAAVKGEFEPMFWALKLYEWSWTRPLLPSTVRAASEEKFRHLDELKNDEDRWTASDSKVLAVHGKEDFIVPYKNSLYLAELLGDRFELVTLEEGDHALIWTNFELIKNLLLKKKGEP